MVFHQIRLLGVQQPNLSMYKIVEEKKKSQVVRSVS